ncbi:hypothetical protein DFH09DRAFT_1419250 [Mycena vulgaris]|nr:hypothetical protein DFH09DRAFT_1419250 [Mycena vulgaris]
MFCSSTSGSGIPGRWGIGARPGVEAKEMKALAASVVVGTVERARRGGVVDKLVAKQTPMWLCLPQAFQLIRRIRFFPSFFPLSDSRRRGTVVSRGSEGYGKMQRTSEGLLQIWVLKEGRKARERNASTGKPVRLGLEPFVPRRTVFEFAAQRIFSVHISTTSGFNIPVRSPGSQIEPDGRKSNRFYTVCKMADGSMWQANLVQQKEPHRATYNNIILPVFLATFPPHSRPRRPPSPSAAGLQPRPFMVPRVFGTAVPVVEPARRWCCCISWLVVAWR